MRAIDWATCAFVVLAVTCALLLWLSYHQGLAHEADEGAAQAPDKIEVPPVRYWGSVDGEHYFPISPPLIELADDAPDTAPLYGLPDVYPRPLEAQWAEWEYVWPAREYVTDEREDTA